MSLVDEIKEITEGGADYNICGDMCGIVAGVVTKNSDDEHKGMVCVKVVSRESKGNLFLWVKVAMPMSGKNWGLYYLPEIGDEVLVAFAYGSVENPYVIGAIPKSDSQLVSKSYHKDNFTKEILTKGGNSVTIYDEDNKQSVTVKTKAEHTLLLDDDKKLIKMSDKSGDNYIKMDTGKGEIEIQAKQKIILKTGSVKVEINGGSNSITVNCNQFTVDSKQSVRMKTSSMNLSADASFEAKASGAATLQSDSMVNVKGAMVKLG